MGQSSSAPKVTDENVFRDHPPTISLEESRVSIKVSGGHTVLMHCCTWKGNNPEWEPKGVVLIAHGLHEHGLKFHKFAHTLVQDGYVVIAPDHLYHGRTSFEGESPKLGLLRSAPKLLDGFQAISAEVKKKFPDIPMIVVGHSMGTLISIITAKRNPAFFSGIILSAIALQPGPAAGSPFGCRCLFPLTKLLWIMRPLTWLLATLDPSGPAAPLDLNAVVSHPMDQKIFRRDPYR